VLFWRRVFPILWQEFGDTRIRMVGNAAEDVLEIGKRFHAVQLGGRHQRINQRRALGALVRAGKEIILPPQRHRPNRILPAKDGIVDLETTVADITLQLRPLAKGVANGFAHDAHGQNFARLLIQPRFDRKQNRPGGLLPKLL
jgi:hypothetical protein